MKLRHLLRSPAATAGQAIILSLQIAAAQAQSQPPITLDEGLRRQEERAREQQRDLEPHADELKPARPDNAVPELPDERPCFAITQISLQGQDAGRFTWLAASTDAFVGHCIGAQGVARIVAYLDRQLIERGYATSRIGVGPQNLGAGHLDFQLLAGRIAEVRMVDTATRATDTRWGTWINAFPTDAGRLLNVRDLEQGVEQMKRLPSQNVTTTLSPGRDPDTSVLTIERESGELKDRVRGGITLDNSGGPMLGRTQLSANLALDNLLGVNDIASVSLNGNAEQPRSDHRSQSASLNYSLPFGYSTVSAGASHSRFAQNVQLTTARVLSTGDSDTVDLKWERVAWRSASTKAGFYVDLSTRRSRSFLDDTELVTQGRQTTFVEPGISVKTLFANNASVEGSIGYRIGVPWLGAHADLPAEAGVTLRPRIWTLNAGAVVPSQGASQRGWQYSATLRAQFTSSATTPIDQIAIGNRASVRGFDGDSVLLAENGWTLRNELSGPLRLGAVDSMGYVGLDVGRVWGAADINLPGHTLAGAVIGLRGRWKAWQFDLALAAPLVKPEGFATDALTPYLSATYAF